MSSETPDRIFATLLRRFRLAAGLTQEQLAERARLSVRGVNDLERGARLSPRRDTVRLLAEALGLSPTERDALVAAAQGAARPGAVLLPRDPPPGTTARPDLPMVGRAPELAMLARHLAGQGPPVLLLAGEPGIGKSRLLHETRSLARRDGWAVLHGGCQRSGGQEPYAPMLQALDRQIQRLGPARLRPALQGCAWLVRLLPELADGPIPPLPGWTATIEQERRLMVGAVARFMANVAGPAGTVLVLDDLQWAGSEAFALLQSLAGAAEDGRLRIVGAYRDTEARPGEALSGWLTDLTQAGLVTRQALSPLAAEESVRLLEALAGPVAPVARERVLARTGGLPFFVVSCAQALQLDEHGDARSDALPWDAAQSVRQRVEALPEDAREVLGMAAVAGREATYTLLGALTAGAAHDLPAALDAACRLRLLEEIAGEHAYRFTHDLIREVVEADLGLARRVELHRRIAGALEGRAGQPAAEEIAFHYARTQEHARAAHWLERAGDRAAAVYSMETALERYRTARERLVASGGEADALAGLDEKLGAALITLGRYDEALATLDRAVAAYGSAQDLEGLRRAAAALSRVYEETDDIQGGLARLLALRDAVEAAEPTPGLAAFYGALADLDRDAARKLHMAMRAEELARAVGDRRLLAAALEKRGTALMYGGRLEEAEAVLLETCTIAEAAGEITNLCFALDDLAWIHAAQGKIAAAQQQCALALEVAERRGNPFQIALVLNNSGRIAFYHEGDWPRARGLWERAVALNRRAVSHGWSVASALQVSRLYLAIGEQEKGIRCLEEGIAMARPDHLWARRWGGWIRAEREVLDGDPGAALDRLVALLDRPGMGEEEDVAHLLPILALAHLALGGTAEAADRARHGVRRIGERVRHSPIWGDRVALADALRVQALVTLRQGQAADAKALLEEGLGLARSIPYPYGEARLLHVYGQWHSEQGAAAPAREHLEAALAILRRLGALVELQRTERLLATLH